MSQVTSNPFKYTDTNKRYHTYDYHLRHTFGGKCAKITLDAGLSCPNIDGRCGVGGCIYCSGGSASRTVDSLLPLEAQYRAQIDGASAKWKGLVGFIPYLQAYSNTYTSPDNLRKILDEVSKFEGAVSIDIATRADCLENEKIDILGELSERMPVTLELGLQSSDDETARIINRGHTFATFEDTFKRVRERAPKVKIAVHIINGLPGENHEKMMKTAHSLSLLKPDIIKIHLLHVIEGTPLAKLYKDGDYTPMTLEDYVATVCDQLEILPGECVIERVTGDGQRDTLLAPLWSLKKTVVINEIDKELFKRGSYQGRYYNEN